MTARQSAATLRTVSDAGQKRRTGSYFDKGSSGRSSARSMAPRKPSSVWIVDYDLPQGNIRRNFYRRVSKRLQQMGDTGVTGWSTQSVVITEDREFAEFVYQEAIKLGVAHLYKAEKVK